MLSRSVFTAVVASVLLTVVVLASDAPAEPPQDHPVVGRFALTSEAGGAVWTFQPSGALFVTGPGEIVSEGRWSAAAGEGEFDAQVDVVITGQELTVLGQVSPDGESLAVYVAATDPARPEDWTPWPPESRLVGQRTGMVTDPQPTPSPAPPDCARPAWVDGAVDWDRCDATLVSAP